MKFLQNAETLLDDAIHIIPSVFPTLITLALLAACWLGPVEGILGPSFYHKLQFTHVKSKRLRSLLEYKS